MTPKHIPELRFDSSHADRIRTGEKTATIRYGFDLPIEPGDTLRLTGDNGDEILRVTVEDVQAKTVGEIIREGVEGHRSYDSPLDLEAEFHDYYPGVTFTKATALTVVSWTAETTGEKGERNEREAANIIGRVYGSGNVEKVDVYSNSDPFGLVDVMAVREGWPVLFVQVKTNRFTAEDRRKYVGRARKLPDDVRVEVWVRVDREGWRMHRYDHDHEEFTQYIEMDTCDYETTAETYREAIGFYEDGDSA